jgi:opacity protein-like surface antigen
MWTTPAAAYRPFDGTDAAVADVGEVEIELQPAGAERVNSESTLIAPFVVYNYGFAERWELVLQGQAETPLSTPGSTSFTDGGVFLKYVIREGVLQEKPGPSVATEFGPLLPDINGVPGTGLSWAGIVSQRWDWGTAHFNVETNLTRDHRGELFLDAIIEGPYKWTVRPVCEIFSDTIANQSQSFSVLAGAIWQVRDNLSFDAAYRHAVVNGQPVDELRAGLTFGFSTNLGKSNSSEASNSMQVRRR